MSIKLIFFLVIRFLFSSPRKSRRSISLIVGISFAFVPLIVVQNVAVGMIEGMTERFIETESYHLLLETSERKTFSSLESLRYDLETDRGVKGAFIEARSNVILLAESRQPALLRALSHNLWAEDEAFRHYVTVERGEFELGGGRKIVLGQSLADSLSLEVGDDLQVLFFEKRKDFVTPRLVALELTGVVSSGFRELDAFWAFVSYEEFARVLPQNNTKQYVGLKITHPYGLPHSLTPDFLPSLARNRDQQEARATLISVGERIGDNWILTPWYRQNRDRYSSFRVTRQYLMILMILICVIACLTSVTFVMRLFKEKKSDITLLRFLGMKVSLLRYIFVCIGCGIGLVSATFGVIVSSILVLFINDIIYFVNFLSQAIISFLGFSSHFTDGVDLLNIDYYLENIPFRLDFSSLFLATTFLVCLSTLSAYLPARRFSRLALSNLQQRRVI